MPPVPSRSFPGAVIFDFDGTLVDTETIGAEVSTELLQDRFGIRLTDHDRREFWGLLDATYYERLCGRYGLIVSAADLLAEHESLYARRLSEIDAALPGAEELVRWLAGEGWRLAVCSGSLRRQIVPVLKNLGLLGCFDVIVSAEDTTRHKPEPDPYLRAIEYLDLPPECCWAVEDSVLGVLSARAAGLFCIGVRAGSRGTEDLRQADAVVERLDEAGPLFGEAISPLDQRRPRLIA